MRKFNTYVLGEVDLDNPETYRFLPTTINELDALMFRDIGFALTYMDYFHPDVFPNNPITINDRGYYGWLQRDRIKLLIKDFAENRKHNWENIQWFKEHVFIFKEEIENMC